MPYLQQPYTGPVDQARMLALVRACPANHLRNIDLPYRFSSWALDEPHNAALWVDPSGKLAAWAVMQAPWWQIDLAFAPAIPAGLRAEVLDWTDQRARQALGTPYGVPCWFVTVFADDQALIEALQQAGFADQYDVGEDSWSKVWMQRPVEMPVKNYRIPAGFSVRPLAGEGEVAAYVALHQETFGSKNMTIEWRRRTLAQPDYNPDLDIVVQAPEGQLAAFCIGWLERSGGRLRGQIEPLGCLPEFSRYALGRLALAEVLRRLQAAGAQSIHVETDNYRDTARALYEHMGFETRREVHVWRKDFGS